jgi:Flp pilus assembly protein TadD
VPFSSRRAVVFAIAWTIAGCTPPTQAPPEKACAPIAPTWPLDRQVTWVDLKAEGGPTEAARRLAAAEWALTAIPYVTTRVEGVTPAGAEGVLDGGAKTWSLTLGPDTLELCGAWSACEEFASLREAIERMGFEASVELLELNTAEARDAATLYGMRRNGRRARGDSGAGGLWIRGRRQLAGGATGRAVVLLQRAVARDPARVPLLASLAAAQGRNQQPGRALGTWAKVEALSPHDPRFAASHLAAELAAGDNEAAEARLRSLPASLRSHPAVVAARSQATDPKSDATQNRAPVRSVPGADALRRGRPSAEEIDRTLAHTRDPVALVARGEARLALDRPRQALADADAALKRSPWLPEALALRAASLDALGRHSLARVARDDLRHADPGSGTGPRRLQNAREAGAALDHSD